MHFASFDHAFDNHVEEVLIGHTHEPFFKVADGFDQVDVSFTYVFYQ